MSKWLVTFQDIEREEDDGTKYDYTHHPPFNEIVEFDGALPTENEIAKLCSDEHMSFGKRWVNRRTIMFMQKLEEC